jgi:Fe/S biogenesis protein NfuA
MISVTALAHSKIHEFIERESDVGHRIRLVARKVAPYRFDYDLFFIDADEIGEDDTQQAIGDLLFVADAASAANLEGAAIDFVEGPPGGFKFDNPHAKRTFDDPLEAELNDFIEDVINPMIAAHRGHISLRRIKDHVVYLEMGGSCQGCGMAAMTLRNNVERQIQGRFPHLREIVDVTNHDEGADPYYERAR